VAVNSIYASIIPSYKYNLVLKSFSYGTLVMGHPVQYSKEAFFPPGNNSDNVFSSFLHRFSSFYKMEIVTFRTSHKLFTIYSDFFHFFLKLSTLKLSNSSGSNGILLPLSRACLQFDYFCLN
jgi:hypothetical protein